MLRCCGLALVVYFSVCPGWAVDFNPDSAKTFLDDIELRQRPEMCLTSPEEMKEIADRNAKQAELAQWGSKRTYPQWDGIESAAEYAKRIGVPPTLEINLGCKTILEMVLIPNGRVTVGTAAPVKPEVSLYRTVESQTIIGIGASFAIGLLIIPLGRALRLRQRPIFSIRWLMIFTLGLSLVFFGTVRLCEPDPWVRYHEALARYEQLPQWERGTVSKTIAQPFYMSRYKVTQIQSKQVWNQPYTVPGNLNPLQITEAYELKIFCDDIDYRVPMEQSYFRLPTDAEWEFACRAGSTGDDYVDGNDSELDAVAWYSINSGRAIQPVGMKRPNSFGLFDMLGDLQECAVSEPDWRFNGYSVRGGSWNSTAQYCRAASRQPFERNEVATIRLVLPCWVSEIPKQ
jgi:hypothetical protein